MKKNKNLFAFMTLIAGLMLTSCEQTPSTPASNGGTSGVPSITPTPSTPSSVVEEPMTAKEALDGIQKVASLSLEGSLKANYYQLNDVTQKGEQTISSKAYVGDDEYYALGTYDNGVDAINLHYFKNSEGQLIKKTVDHANAVSEQIVYKTTSSAEKVPLMYDEAIANPFTFVSETDFVESTAHTATFNLTKEVGASTLGNLVYNVLTGYDVPAEKMVITYSENNTPTHISIVGARYDKKVSRVDYVYTYNYEADFVTKDVLKVPTYPYAKNTEDMSKLQSALDLIKNHNYEMKLYSSFVNDGLTPNISAKVTPNGFIVKNETTDDAPYGMINVGNNRAEIQIVEDKSTGKVTAVGTAKEYENSSVNEYYPAADYSVDLFEKTSDGYVLKDAYQEVTTLIPDANTVDVTYLFGVNVLTFNVADDLSSITYTYIFKGLKGYGVRKVELTNLGTTVLPFNIETDYVKYSKATNWAELDPSAKAEADALIGADLDSVLPFISADGTSFMVYSDSVEIRITCDSEDAANDLKSSYFFDLVFSYGYQEDGTDSYVKDNKYRVDLEVQAFIGVEFIITLTLK